MKKRRIAAGIVLAAFAGLAPLLRHLDRQYSSLHSLLYHDRGIGFNIRDHSRSVVLIRVFEPETTVPDEGGQEVTIVPGRGVGEIRLGDSPAAVEKKWPIDWKRYDFPGGAYYVSPGWDFHLRFADERLKEIWIRDPDYRTAEGLSVGDSREKVLRIYGDPTSFADDRLSATTGETILVVTPTGRLADSITHLLIAAGVLSLASTYLARIEIRRQWPILIVLAYLVFFAIQLNPLLAARIGFQYIIAAARYWYLVIIPVFIFAGLLVGEYFCHRRGWAGLKKHATVVVAANLGATLSFLYAEILRSAAGYPAMSRLWDIFHLLIQGSLLYLFWFLFNLVFLNTSRLAEKLGRDSAIRSR